jgi:MoxR-like ATPase
MTKPTDRFEGTSNYIATNDLKIAVNASVALQRPLLIKGEPGTGKTVLAYEMAKALNAPLITWHVKSTTKAHNGLYEYDAVSRLRDSQLGEERVHDVRNYLKKGKLWEAFTSPVRPVLLIDEIDKADIEFPNDLLQELDRMEFYVQETDETIRAEVRPVVVITSNNEKELPDAFLRRCFFHYIRFPDDETMRSIIEVHFPGIKQRLVSEALKTFYEIRDTPGLKKKPSTSELLDWLKLLLVEDIDPETLREKTPNKLIPPLHGALLKNEQDVHLFERLAFLNRREGARPVPDPAHCERLAFHARHANGQVWSCRLPRFHWNAAAFRAGWVREEDYAYAPPDLPPPDVSGPLPRRPDPRPRPGRL